MRRHIFVLVFACQRHARCRDRNRPENGPILHNQTHLAIVLNHLAQVWLSSRALAGWADRLDFWFNLVAVVVAVFNAFVHSRDAYAVVPAGVILSACTVALLVLGQAAMAVQAARRGELR